MNKAARKLPVPPLPPERAARPKKQAQQPAAAAAIGGTVRKPAQVVRRTPAPAPEPEPQQQGPTFAQLQAEEAARATAAQAAQEDRLRQQAAERREREEERRCQEAVQAAERQRLVEEHAALELQQAWELHHATRQGENSSAAGGEASWGSMPAPPQPLTPSPGGGGATTDSWLSDPRQAPAGWQAAQGEEDDVEGLLALLGISTD